MVNHSDMVLHVLKSHRTFLSLGESGHETFGEDFLRQMCSWKASTASVGKYSPHLGNTCRQFITIKRYNQHTNFAPHWKKQCLCLFPGFLSWDSYGCEVQAACSDLVNTLVRCEQDLWMCLPLFGLVRFGGFNIFCVGTCCISTSASSAVCRAGCMPKWRLLS